MEVVLVWRLFKSCAVSSQQCLPTQQLCGSLLQIRVIFVYFFGWGFEGITAERFQHLLYVNTCKGLESGSVRNYINFQLLIS